MPDTEMFLPRNRRPVPTRTRLSTRRLPVVVYVAVLILLPALVVSGAMAAGWWSSSGHGSVASTGAGAGTGAGREAGGSGVGAPAAPADPADVKGSTTVRQVADAFAPVTPAQILAAFEAPAGTPDGTQLKALVNEGGDGGMDIPAFRTWLRQRTAR